MKIAHLSDTHLGYSGTGIQRRVEDPDRPGVTLRQQEADIFRGLRLAIDRIVELRPDIVVHSGDLFDHAHPQPHAIDFAMRQLRRLGEAGIPLIIVEGDHSCPRITEQGQVLRLLLHLPHIHVVCGSSESIRVGEALIHAVPHRAVAQGFTLETNCTDRDYANILVVHAVADGYPFYNTSRHAASFGIRDVADRFDYVALGHCHRFYQVRHTNRAFYSGTTAMVAAGDFSTGCRFGFNLVDVTTGVPTVSRQEIETRPMHAYGLHDASGLSAKEIVTFLVKQLEAVPPTDAYCNLVIDGIDPIAKRELSVREVHALFDGCASLSPQILVRQLCREEASSTEVENSPRIRFERLAKNTDGSPEFVEAVCSLGLEILNQAEAVLSSEESAEED